MMSERKKLMMVEAIDSGMAAEGARAGGARASSVALIAVPDPEVRAVAKRRSFTAAYKLAVLAKADCASGSGEICALLRCEGL